MFVMRCLREHTLICCARVTTLWLLLRQGDRGCWPGESLSSDGGQYTPCGSIFCGAEEPNPKKHTDIHTCMRTNKHTRIQHPQTEKGCFCFNSRYQIKTFTLQKCMSIHHNFWHNLNTSVDHLHMKTQRLSICIYCTLCTRHRPGKHNQKGC